MTQIQNNPYKVKVKPIDTDKPIALKVNREPTDPSKIHFKAQRLNTSKNRCSVENIGGAISLELLFAIFGTLAVLIGSPLFFIKGNLLLGIFMIILGAIFGGVGILMLKKKQPKPPVASISKQTSALVLDNTTKFEAAVALHQQGQLEQAGTLYKEILQSQPEHFDALQFLAAIAIQQKNFVVALELFEQAIKINPSLPSSHNNRGTALLNLNRVEEALKSYDCAIKINPDYVAALSNRGYALYKLKRHEEALEFYDRAIKINPDYVDALNNRGTTMRGLNRYGEALESFERALMIKPDYVEALKNRAIALLDLKRHEEALESYNRALKIKPDDAEALNGLGTALLGLNRHEQALESYDRALRISPDFAVALSNRGNALLELNRNEEALKSYDRALEIEPNFAEALNNRGLLLLNQGRHEEAIESIDRALKIKPDFADALNNRGLSLTELNRHEEALQSYGRALTIQPGYDFLHGNWLHAKMMICDWHDIEDQFIQLAKKVERNEIATPPFAFLAISSCLALQRKAAEIWVQTKYPSNNTLPKISKYTQHDKIRIGYFSADFRFHPVSILTAELFEKHDRSKFELTAFSFGPDTKDEMRGRLEAAFDRFIDVRSQSDKDVAMLARNLEIDFAVDLGGFTQAARTGIFAMRAAPIQLSYLGYLGTMGAEYIDYLIADTTIIPEADQRHYAEKIVYLPSYQANDTKRRIADKAFTRAELGLPQTGFVFCCLNNNYKITPGTFDGWMRILKQVEGSVLWLVEHNAKVVSNLRSEAEFRGVNGNRLVFAKRLSPPEYLASYRAADLFLDTLPYNAGTTASDALWAGLPVLTCLGETFAGRIAASLLKAIHLPELIASTPEAYEALAVELATNPDKQREIKRKLACNRLTTPLFDIRLFTRHIEAAYKEMYERNQVDLAPEHIYVQDQLIAT
jgi:predicted O-linked N-acetylglucosamine transferase (SPINDLY family)